MDENLLKALKRLNYGDENEEKKEYIEIKTHNDIVDSIKVEFNNNNATVIEPQIKFDGIEESRIVFQDTTKEQLTEDSIHIKLFDKIMNNKDKILESLYQNTLKFLINWEEIGSEDLNVVKDETSIYIIEIGDGVAFIKASVYNEETDESLLGGHFVETMIKLDNENLEWNLS